MIPSGAPRTAQNTKHGEERDRETTHFFGDRYSLYPNQLHPRGGSSSYHHPIQLHIIDYTTATLPQ